ncbi:heme peroxidase [Abortiporus biennis]|nr:heme peroxidase [Abortiporus biennis]
MDRLNSFTSFTSLKETVLAKAPSLATIKTTLTAVVRFRGNTEAPPLRKTPEPESQPKLKPPPHKHPIVTPFEQLRSPSSGNGWFGTEPGIDDRALTLQRGLALISERGVAEPALSNIKKAAVEIFNNAQHNTEPPKDREPAADAAKQLPPAQEVFDELLQRKQNTVGHTNNGLSRMTSAFMDLIWLNTFKPDSTGAQMNSISPTFDLFPLYGPETSTIDIRLKDGYGRLAPDCFYDDRLFFMSDATSVLLILLNRNHNFIAQQLLNHPRSSWVTPNDVFDMDSGIIKPDWEKQDEEIFRMARLINCAQFRNIVSEDFLKLLSGLASVGPGLNLGKQITTYDHSREYQSTPETSCLYDWHALTSEEDLLRLKADIKRVFGQDNNVPQDLSVVPDVISKASMTSRTLRNHARLQRGTDNKFVDTELADILRNAISSSAMPSASGVPQYLRNVAIDKIQRARKASSHTLNEYRKALGLKVYKDFKDWNSDPTVCEAAKKLYTTIDNLELYVGLQAEQAVPDSGLQFGYTKTFALLADVVSKISNDPISRQVKDLPQWTSDMCDPEASLGNGAFGAWLPIIIQRSLPESFPYNNTYGLFPLATPEYVQTSFKKLESQLKTPKAIYTTSDEDVRKFSISRYSTTLPAGSSTVHTLITREAISHVLNDPKKFPTPYGESLKAITNGYGYLLGFDDPNMHDRDLMLTLYSLMPDRSVLNRYRSQFSQMVKQRLKAKSKQASNTNAVDIVNDVINPVCIKWVCKTLCAYEIPEAQESKMHEGLGDLYAFIFRNVHTDKAWKLRESAKRVSEILKSHIREKLPPPPKSHLRDLSESSYYMGSFQSLVPYLKRVSMEFFSKGLHLRLADPPTFLDRIVLANSGLPLDDETYRQLAKQYNIQKIQRNVELNNVDITRIAANIIGLAVVVSINYARSCAEAVDFYLDPARSQEREQLIKLAKKPRSAKNDELIMGYIREAQRIDQPLGIWRIVAEDTVIPSGDGDEVKFVAGDRIYADLREMHCKPATIDPQRRTPTVQGMGFHKCPGITFVEQVRG